MCTLCNVVQNGNQYRNLKIDSFSIVACTFQSQVESITKQIILFVALVEILTQILISDLATAVFWC